MFVIRFLNITRKSRNFHAFTQAYLAHAQTSFLAAMQYSLEAGGFASMANVRWSDGSTGSTGQVILRSDKYFTDGEMT